jgi:hypothetical protein
MQLNRAAQVGMAALIERVGSSGVEGGEGQFAGASGLITSNFLFAFLFTVLLV